MNPIGRSFSTKIIEKHIIKFPGMQIENQVDDQPRQVKNSHYCRSIPKIRNSPKIAGLSSRCLEMIGYSFDEVLNDEKSPEILSGSVLA
jgi:nitrogenase molybdenum-iron protein alpha/beta subunit